MKKRTVKDWIPPAGEFADAEAVLIIGGGSSIRELGHDKLLEKMEGRYPAIACNSSFLICPWAEMLFGADIRWWNDNRFLLSRHLGWWKVARRAPAGRLPFPLHLIKAEHQGGLSLVPGVIRGRNSGHMALNVAVQMGAKKIILIGMDMNEKAAKQHFHTLHSRPANTDGFDLWRKDFALAAPVLQKAGIQVMNANPASGLQVFPFCNLEDYA